MNLNPSIDYNGECEEAFRLYESCLGGEITAMLTYGGSPLAATRPELAGKIIHATLALGEHKLSGGDVPPSSYKPPQGFAIQLDLDDYEAATRIYDTLSAGGKILVPLQRTFWADLFAVFTDRFGTPWKINFSEGD